MAKFLVGFMMGAVLGVFGYVSIQNTETIPDVIKIGYAGPTDTREDIIEAFAGSGLENIELVYEEVTCSEKSVINAVAKFATIDSVAAVASEACPQAAFAAIPVAIRERVSFINTTSTIPVHEEESGYIFHVLSETPHSAFSALLLALKDGASTREEVRHALAVLSYDGPASTTPETDILIIQGGLQDTN